jgi:uncharacterized membrane protein YkvA (DUF1232 family)
MTATTERARRQARKAEDATLRAIDEGTQRLRKGLRSGTRSARDAAPRVRKASSGAKRTLMDTIRLLPGYLRLLGGLLGDRRVSTVDKLLVAAAIAYVVSPVDFIPDWIPFLGQVDDVYLVVTALQRLISNAGRRVVRAHWDGPMRYLEDATLANVISAAAVFLPRGIRRRLNRVR